MKKVYFIFLRKYLAKDLHNDKKEKQIWITTLTSLLREATPTISTGGVEIFSKKSLS